MSGTADRLDAVEEKLMQLQLELEELDNALKGHMAAHDQLARRVERAEARLDRVAAGTEDAQPGGRADETG